jgi:hypothetical protein
VRQAEGFAQGPAFCDTEGRMALSRIYDDLSIEVLTENQEDRPVF